MGYVANAWPFGAAWLARFWQVGRSVMFWSFRVACAHVRPLTAGILTEPLAILRITMVLGFWAVPSLGALPMTKFCLAFGELTTCGVPTTKPACCSAFEAARSVSPLTGGTLTVAGPMPTLSETSDPFETPEPGEGSEPTILPLWARSDLTFTHFPVRPSAWRVARPCLQVWPMTPCGTDRSLPASIL